MEHKLLFAAVLLFSLILSSCTGGNAETGDNSCSAEFTYSIGEIDSRFGVSRTEVQSAVEHALEIWSAAYDTLIWDETDAGRNTIQLVYDERQERADQARRFQERIFDQKQLVERLQEEYEESLERVERRQEEHQKVVDQLNEHLTTFNAWVGEVNRAGGLKEEEIPRYERELETINRLRQNEERIRSMLDHMISEFNQLTERLNRQVDINNELIRRFNETFGEEFHFTGAYYRSDGRRGTISVYYFQDQRELTLLLAHEIGHALGIDHVENSTSVMYPIIMDQLGEPELKLSAEDIEAARQPCP